MGLRGSLLLLSNYVRVIWLLLIVIVAFWTGNLLIHLIIVTHRVILTIFFPLIIRWGRDWIVQTTLLLAFFFVTCVNMSPFAWTKWNLFNFFFRFLVAIFTVRLITYIACILVYEALLLYTLLYLLNFKGSFRHLYFTL